MIGFLKKFQNPLIGYLISRYFTYFIQFVTSILIAVKLGPYFFGIWGFVLLIINYLRVFDFGIANALNVFLVHNKSDEKQISLYTTNSLILVTILSILILIFCSYYYIYGIPFFEKYEIGNYFIYICIIGIITNFNVLLMNIYRVRNSLFYLSLYQSIIPIFIFVSIFISSGKNLLLLLISCHLIGNIISLLLFIFGKKVPKMNNFNFQIMKEIVYKGFYLFIYNLSFYLIVISLKTFISFFYSVEEFGIFSFSFSLSNSILLFLQAITFLIFPKVIDKLRGNNYSDILSTILLIRNSYVTLAYLLVFLAVSFYPLFLEFIPKYKNAITSLTLTSLTVVLYTNSFGFGTFLIAQNKEKFNALISFSSLVMNVVLAYILIFIFKVNFNYVIISTIISYSLYSFLCVFFAKKMMSIKQNIFSIFNSSFPISIFIPFILAIFLVLNGLEVFLFSALILFIILNLNELFKLVDKLKFMITNPNFINLKK